MLLALAAVAVGIAVLAYAADQFVIGAARLARMMQISAIVVGVVIVGFGTSLPEAVVSGIAASRGEIAVAIGNVMGSNLANLTLLLGIAGLMAPLAVASSAVRREYPLTLIATVVLAFVIQDGISTIQGAVLLVAMVAVLAVLLISAMRHRGDDDPLAAEVDELMDTATTHRYPVEITRLLLGLGGTVLGSQLLLWGALEAADILGLRAGFVGATIVALGTSLPELVTVTQSVRRNEPDLVIGNLLGSNLFNSLGVAGIIGIVSSAPLVDRDLTIVAAVGMVIITVIAGVMMRTGRTVSRLEGIGLLVLYGIALATLF